MTHKFMLIYRQPASPDRKPPSPTELEAILAQWAKWKAAFPSVVDMGDGLLPTGKALKNGVVTDGPTIESKELVSGYSLVEAKDYDAAVVVAKACPMLALPGGSIEVRELARY